MRCFPDEALTGAGAVVPEGFGKRSGVRGCRVPGTRGHAESVQDGKCKMPLFPQKRSIISPQTEALGWGGGARERGADPPGMGTSPPQETPGLSVSETTWAPLEFFHCNLYSFFKQIQSG